MGASIHYKLGNIKNLEEGIEVLKKFKERINNLPLEEITDVIVVEDVKNPGNDFDEDQLAYLAIETSVWIGYRQFEAIGFTAFWVTPTNEKASIGFCFSVYPKNLKYIDPNLTNLYWEGSCKTDGNTKHHLLVAAMLDIAEEMGFLLWVGDETGFWKDRNLNVLNVGIDQVLPKEETIDFINKL